MLTVPLDEMGAALEGAIPSPIASASVDGVPNVTYLSVVHRVDADHVALSFQFFNKTKRNVLTNPRAQVIVLDPATLRQFRLSLEYDRTEVEGPIFTRMRDRLAAVASASGMAEVFNLRGADVYRVTEAELLPSNLAHDDSSRPRESRPRDAVSDLAAYAEKLGRCSDLDALLGVALDSLDEFFGMAHSMVLLVDESQAGLFTIASHGYAATGIGSEARLGEGAIGVAADRGRPVRIASYGRDQLLARAVRDELSRTGDETTLGREIPLPGLPDVESQLAVPLVVAGRCLGVLCVESSQPARFTRGDEGLLTAAGQHLAAILALLQANAASDAEAPPALAPSPGAGPTAVRRGDVTVRFYDADDSVFVDGQYLIKGVAGRVLFRLLRQYEEEGRTDFTNKEIRLDPTLELPPIKDNLETRLLLLRRRLEERGGPIILEKTGRGRLRLHVSRGLRLEAGAAKGDDR